MKFVYHTETDRVTSPDLDVEQTARIQSLLSAALIRNDPVRAVAQLLLSAARPPASVPNTSTTEQGERT